MASTTKVKTVFACGSCGTTSPKWMGKCPGCSEWNTMVEEVISAGTRAQQVAGVPAGERMSASGKRLASKPTRVQDVSGERDARLLLPDPELNRCLGGGLVDGALILIGGEPGSGKSTLMLQTVLQLDKPVLYVSGEESEKQIKLRADRVPGENQKCYLLAETDTAAIAKHVKELQPAIIVIDSIQTMSSPLIDSAPGSVSQVRETTNVFQRIAKDSGIPVFIIGHITKEGSIAGPKLLEHIVDVVLQFEGDRNYSYRVLRTLKNRFGSTDELGIYEMRSDGMNPITNPSQLLLAQHEDELSGSAVAATLEGMRPLLIEVQALVSTAVYSTAQRSATGFDTRRLNMLLAVLEKRCGFAFAQNDVFLNIAGGIRVDDPAIDLSIVGALISSFDDVAIPKRDAFAGEVGLSGEVRAVSRIDQRIQEADKHGFERIFVSKYNKGLDTVHSGIEVVQIKRVEDLVRLLFQ
ncbi:MAG: DNA repair protein RadA [Saprospiraceae bacterium]